MTTSIRRPIIAVLATMAIMLAAGLFATGSASAAQTTKATVAPLAKTITYHNRTFMLRKTVTASPSSAAARSSSAVHPQASISCGLYVSTPEFVEPGELFGPYDPFFLSVGSTAFVTCTAPVTSLELEAAIAYEDAITLGPLVSSAANSISPTGYAINVCQGGDWAAGGYATIIWPAGFSPSTGTLAGFAPDVYVDPTDCLTL